MPTIYVSGLFDMPDHVEQFNPTHLISIIQPELQPERPPEIDPERHLRVATHDIVAPDGYSVVPGREHVRSILQFLGDWEPPHGDLLVHCYAGVSRSTATALLAHFLKTGGLETGDADASAAALRQAAPHASPNRLLIQLADEVLELKGALVRAVDRMGPRGPLDRDEFLTRLEL